MKKIKIYLGVIFLLIIVITITTFYCICNKKVENKLEEENIGKKIDDWAYESQSYNSKNDKGMLYSTARDVSLSSFSNEESYLGFSTGGAKDINNFRENIENGYFPLSSDITYEGIFYDYNFDTGNDYIDFLAQKQYENELFYPTYSTAISKDPISNNNEYYLSVGLNSNIKESDFERKKLNLVLVLDISGSMSSSLDSYYYDFEENGEEKKSKMKLAEESINILLNQLNDNDSFGVVLFDDDSYIGKEISLVGETDIEAIKKHILEIEPMGGTNFEAGYRRANELIEDYGLKSSDEYENRIIIITDAMPNYGASSSSDLLRYMHDNAMRNIYTTFLGVGVDFDTELVKKITDVRGANYYSISSEEEFKTRMGEEFEYMVTPLVYDLDFSFESDDFEIAAIYGTDSIDSETGNIMHVNTLFPSPSNEEGEVKGGIILLKLKKLTDNEDSNIILEVSYEDRSGEVHNNEQMVRFIDNNEEYYDNTGIRKGIVLSRYVNVIKNWIEYERSSNDRYLIDVDSGIVDLPIVLEEDYSNENERLSVDLIVSEEYKQIFMMFKEYFEFEINQIDDETMLKEVEILEQLI